LSATVSWTVVNPNRHPNPPAHVRSTLGQPVLPKPFLTRIFYNFDSRVSLNSASEGLILHSALFGSHNKMFFLPSKQNSNFLKDRNGENSCEIEQRGEGWGFGVVVRSADYGLPHGPCASIVANLGLVRVNLLQHHPS
jgi:hypothetical protein